MDVTSSGASAAHSDQAPSTSTARSTGQISQPAYASRTGYSSSSSCVTTPMPSPPQRPEEVGVRVRIEPASCPVGGHDLGRDDARGREPVLPAEPADAPAEHVA